MKTMPMATRARLQRTPATQTALRLAAAWALACGGGTAIAQSITSGPSSALSIPVDSMWALAAATVAVIYLAAYALRGGRRRHVWPLVLATCMVAGALWNGATPWAQVLAQFTQPGGETLPIPVVSAPVAGMQRFEPVDYRNATGRDLRITAIDAPDYAECFPVPPLLPLAPPITGGPPACAPGSPLTPGASCRVDVHAICTAQAAQTMATISISPASLTFVTSGSASVTVTATSARTAQNVMATIPAGSNLSVQSSTCGAMLASGASCTITFTGSAAEGPTAVTVAGSNTNGAALNVTVTSPSTIAISAPSQSQRVIAVGSATPLALTVTNTGAATAYNISANVSATPDVVVDASNCTAVAPAASCTLQLTSNTAYAPSSLTVSGSNTANTPTALVAFSHLGGLVFEASGSTGKVVIDGSQGFASQWTGSNASIPGAASTSDGAANTAAIIVDASCSGAPGSCAAQRCRNIGPDWYLPAVNEMSSVRAALCPSGSGCNFSSLSGTHLTSTQTSAVGVRLVIMPAGTIAVGGKAGTFAARCVRAFTQ